MYEPKHRGYFERLPRLEGFSFLLKPSRPDELAYAAAIHEWGHRRVDGILSVLKRASLSYDDLMEDFIEYDRPHTRICRDRNYQLAYQSVLDQFTLKEGVKKLIPFTTGAIPRYKDFPGAKSPGLPWKNRGYRTKRDVANDQEAMREVNANWQKIGAGINVRLPDVAMYARAQICTKDKNKIRCTWGYPFDVYIEEARFFYPIMEFLKDGDHSIPIAYGYEMANGGMHAIDDGVMASLKSGCKIIVGDWSKFDKTIPPWLIRDSFRVLEQLIDFDHVKDVEGKVWHVRGYRSVNRWNKLIRYFIDTPVRTCKGERFMKHAGVPSGSCFTNIIDTIVNMIVWRYLCISCAGHWPTFEMYLGDDCNVGVRPHVNIDDMSALAKEKFGMELNVAKTYVTTNPRNVHFLGYFNHHGYPFKNLDFLIASFIQPEHTRRTALEAAAAGLGQLFTCFDSMHACAWLRVVKTCAAFDAHSVGDAVQYLKNHQFRHKYLMTVGVTGDKISVPVPYDHIHILRANAPVTGKPWKPIYFDVHTIKENLEKRLNSRYALLSVASRFRRVGCG